jgi:hypothetical protein
MVDQGSPTGQGHHINKRGGGRRWQHKMIIILNLASKLAAMLTGGVRSAGREELRNHHRGHWGGAAAARQP